MSSGTVIQKNTDWEHKCREEINKVNNLKRLKREILKGKAQYGDNVEVNVWSSEKEEYVKTTLEEVEEMLSEAEKMLEEKKALAI